MTMRSSVAQSPSITLILVALSVFASNGLATADQANGRPTAIGQTAPSARASVGMAYDGATKEVVLFGGSHGTTRFGDTWTWDGASWTRQVPPSSPPARSGMGMAYDAAIRRIVLFGGCCRQGGSLFNDTWTWDGTTWTRMHPSISPPGTAVMGMAYDGTNGEVVMFGGETTPGSTESTWTWNGTDWTEQHPRHVPQWVEGPALTQFHGGVMMFGGDWDCFEDICFDRKTWTWNGHDWQAREQTAGPTGRSYLAMASGIGAQPAVMFGGFGYGGGSGALHDTWTWDGKSWTRQAPTQTPHRRWATGMAYDEATQTVVLFGGQDDNLTYRDFRDTWLWNGMTWQPVR
jgi:hypothetical protein